MPSSDPKGFKKELKKYKEYVRRRLAKLTPILQKTAIGGFSGKIEIPEKEDEFTELVVGLSLMLEDLQALEKERRETEEATKERLAELERWRGITVGREIKMVAIKKEMERLKEEIKSLKKE